jgi:hypothetical protein
MTRYWNCKLRGEGEPAMLYVETNDAAIEHDMTLPPGRSLILSHAGMPKTDEEKHRALARAAFSIHSRRDDGGRLGELEEAGTIPPGLESFWTGGDGDTCSVVVFRGPSLQ